MWAGLARHFDFELKALGASRLAHVLTVGASAHLREPYAFGLVAEAEVLRL